MPAARHAFNGCDALLTVGTRFSEIPTGSFGAQVSTDLVHVDIDASVFGANYPARVAVEGDACAVLSELLSELKRLALAPPALEAENTLKQQIARDKAAYLKEWLAHDSGGRVNPARFFAALRAQMPADSITVLDDGNHTFLAAELYPQPQGAQLITPTDFNAMGYAVPAGIGAKLAAAGREVAVIVGDGCFAMTCMEIMTAAANRLGVVFYVFKDGALSQIAQAQQRPYQRLTCTELGQSIDLAGVAQATGAACVLLPDDASAPDAIAQARAGGRRPAGDRRRRHRLQQAHRLHPVHHADHLRRLPARAEAALRQAHGGAAVLLLRSATPAGAPAQPAAGARGAAPSGRRSSASAAPGT